MEGKHVKRARLQANYVVSDTAYFSKVWIVEVVILVTMVNMMSQIGPIMAICPSSCGNISIPYPFGIQEGCGLPEFQLSCRSNDTSGLAVDPALFLNTLYEEFQVTSFNTTTLVINITNFKAMSCYGDYIAGGFNHFGIPSNSPYALSPNNYFFAEGCRSGGNVSLDGTPGGGCQTGCTNIDIVNYCLFYGCCSIPIFQGTREVSFYGGGINYADFADNICGFSSIIYPESFVNPFDQVYVGAGQWGLELAWAIPGFNITCEIAEKQANYSCFPNVSSCIIPGISTGWATNFSQPLGYNCMCNDGYSGDGYLLGTGCTDINECLHDTLNSCARHANCINMPGSYNCACEHNYIGNGFNESVVNGSQFGISQGTGCKAQSSHEASLIVGVTVGPMLAIVLILGAIVWIQIRRAEENKRRIEMDQNEISNLKAIGREYVGRRFSFHQLNLATNGFHVDGELGVGASGKVYKGIIEGDDAEILVAAIKKPKDSRTFQEEDRQVFLNEVGILSQFNHENVVKLLGCCLQTKIPLLVYEYISEGSLYDHLHGKRSYEGRLSSLSQRLQIAIEVAEGLKYIHHDASPPFVHRDIKSANILLAGETLTAKLADFGISRLQLYAFSESTNPGGTFGYMDPQVLDTVHVTDKRLDVYSFGVVLFELLTSTKPLRREGDSLINVPNDYWIPKVVHGKFHEIVDPKLIINDSMVIDVLEHMVNLAIWCLKPNRQDRPSMIEVVGELRGLGSLIGKKGIGKQSYGFPLGSQELKMKYGPLAMEQTIEEFPTNIDDYGYSWEGSKASSSLNHGYEGVELDTQSFFSSNTPNSTELLIYDRNAHDEPVNGNRTFARVK